MAVQTVSGASPVTFISEDTTKGNNGTQFQIPLSLITYDATATPPVILDTVWTAFLVTGDQNLAVAYIQNLINDGALSLVT
ncbi:MAG TPA: hypothetical protein VGG68_08900 [Caulobacteraceae bacterium]|jgi:hypothetical protein